MVSTSNAVNHCNSMYQGLWKYHYCRFLRTGWISIWLQWQGALLTLFWGRLQTGWLLRIPPQKCPLWLFYFKGAPFFSPPHFLLSLNECSASQESSLLVKWIHAEKAELSMKYPFKKHYSKDAKEAGNTKCRWQYPQRLGWPKTATDCRQGISRMFGNNTSTDFMVKLNPNCVISQQTPFTCSFAREILFELQMGVQSSVAEC